ncbi:hypothetical protein EYF80_013184 [Liparis tanakae]|uniref:Uncharacterized protein n=1 Tax=Liparis tanakae TaxID=230148 RepID=A0A4Z2IGI5_9TELE|nr:hypothetical protein EYF80_013184 [Liparis tanakae]
MEIKKTPTQVHESQQQWGQSRELTSNVTGTVDVLEDYCNVSLELDDEAPCFSSDFQMYWERGHKR